MEQQFPLKNIDQNTDKTAEHWFDHYSAEIQKIGKQKIPILNKDVVQKHELIRFRGLITNQLNSEYFNKTYQFRELDDIKQSDCNSHSDCKQTKENIMQRSPMVIRSAPNQTEWSKSEIFGNKNTSHKEIQAVIAKFYCHTKILKICDSVEIYGIWSPKQTQKVQKNQEEKNDKENYNQQNLYADALNEYDKLSSIHVLYYKQITWSNPLISNNLNDLDKLFSFYYSHSSLIRASLIKYISRNYANGDHLLAEYILLNLISKTVANKNGILFGYFPLNIRGEFSNYKIRELYAKLCPFLLNISLSIKYLNTKRFSPVKNNETDELELGILQFADNTNIIIDETLLTTGNLNKIGLSNLESLKILVGEQKVFYDFVFHSIPFNVNSAILILSKKKPLPHIQSYCYIYADNYHGDVKQEEEEEEEEQFSLDEYRIYLSIASYLMDKFTLNSKKVCAEIEEDFVNLRKEESSTNEDTLHHRLLLMRLINASFLNQTNDSDMMNILKYMQMLEKKREVRNEKFTKIQTNSKGTSLNKIDEE